MECRGTSERGRGGRVIDDKERAGRGGHCGIGGGGNCEAVDDIRANYLRL